MRKRIVFKIFILIFLALVVILIFNFLGSEIININKLINKKESIDFSLCNEMERINMREDCYLNLALKERDPSICGKIEREQPRDRCYVEMVFLNEEEKDESICDKINNQYAKDLCYYDLMYSLAYEKDCFYLCDKIESILEKERCYFTYAHVKKDFSICDKIQDKRFRKYCYSYIIEWSNLSICDEILNKSNGLFDENNCYYIIANHRRNILICDKIKEEEERNSCYEGVNESILIDSSDTPDGLNEFF